MSRPVPDVLKLRSDMLNGRFDLPQETINFMDTVRKEIADSTERILQAAPSNYDMGRMIAFVDGMQHAKNLACDSAILGQEASNRKAGSQK